MNISSKQKTYTFLFLLSLLSLTFRTSAQEQPPEELIGKELRQWLKANWYDNYHWNKDITSERFNNPIYLDPYRDSRKEMYNYIDNVNNSIIGVYSGYTVEWTYGGEGSNPQPINTEHTVPQSFFRAGGEELSSEPMRSDIHHLFPTYGAWNSTRSNYPFDDIDDAVTVKWMNLDNEQAEMPSTKIDEYSEFSDDGNYLRFEPREDHKGDVARAIFYFYSMYEDNPDVFRSITNLGEIELLLSWHVSDPVSEKEKVRNDSIANYQGNKNPYILYPDIAERAYDDYLNIEIPLTTIETQEASIYPNPTTGLVNVNLVQGSGYTEVKLINLQGQVMLATHKSNDSYSLDLTHLENGVYTLIITNSDNVNIKRLIKL